jgi:lipopolysaccharide assembly outer membrane protein LptD (OstA)
VSLKQLTLVLIAVLVTGGLVAGQTVQVQKSVTYGPSTRILANELRYDDAQHTTYARGSVRIVSESSTMTADEADLHLLRSTTDAVDLDIVLRGNVRVLVTPLAGGVR